VGAYLYLDIIANTELTKPLNTDPKTAQNLFCFAFSFQSLLQKFVLYQRYAPETAHYYSIGPNASGKSNLLDSL